MKEITTGDPDGHRVTICRPTRVHTQRAYITTHPHPLSIHSLKPNKTTKVT